ncbi:hypothetical protein A9Q99_00800 [Gammaproteobacteria bacterium 45_16_T64]|nr:hypothetical protein A9Q99_00800 [Gammaproteobacteria bacterium 45_16_T64]
MKDKLAANFFKIVGALPLSVNRNLGMSVGWALWACNSELRRRTEINIALCYPKNSAAKNKDLVKQSLIQTGLTLFELGATYTKPPKVFLDRISEVEGEELLRTAQQNGKGVLLLAPHIGNWEIAGFFINRYYMTTTIYKPGHLKALDDMIYKSRTQLGMKVVPANNQGVIALFRLLKKQGISTLLPDQEPDRSGGIFAPLFGVEALTPVIASKMIQKTDATALGLYCLRQSNGRYKIIFKAVDPTIYSTNLLESVTGMNRSIEAFIADAPEQYQWEYRRFSKRPNKEPKLYKKHTRG